MPPQPVTNFEIQEKYYQGEPKFNRGYSKSNLPKRNNESRVTKFDEYKSIGADWIDLYVNGDNLTYLDSFRVECIRSQVKNS